MTAAIASFPRARARGTKLALVIALTLIALFLSFDWNWLRPALVHHLSARSQRQVSIEELEVHFSSRLDPTVTFRGVAIENAPWAARRPLITAREAIATFTLLSLIRSRPVVTRLELVDADVDLERAGDGRRNWRLTDPEYRGPGVVKVLELRPVRSRIRFAHQELDLEVQAAASPTSASNDPEITTRIEFSGRYRGQAFSGDVLTGDELTFQGTRRDFRMRGHATTRTTRLELDGRVSNIFKGATIDAQTALSGHTLADLRFLFPRLTDTPSYVIAGRLNRVQDRTAMTETTAKLGGSDVAGDVALEEHAERKSFHATLRSDVIRLEDLTWLSSFNPAAQTARAPSPSSSGRDSAARAISGPARTQAESSEAYAHLGSLEGDIRLTVKHLEVKSAQASASLSMSARIADSVLTVQPFELGLAGGRGTGEFTLDMREAPGVARLRAKVGGLQIERLLPSLAEKQSLSGRIEASIELSARGRRAQDFLRTASGSVSAYVRDGAMSSRLDARLGLNGWRLLSTLFKSREQVPIRCAIVEFAFREGRGQARTLLIQTDRTSTEGSGTLDLALGEVDLLLTPSSERAGITDLHKAIRLRVQEGHFTHSLAAPQASHMGRSCDSRRANVARATPQ